MIRPFVTPTEDGIVPYMQTKLAILEPIRKTIMETVDHLIKSGKEFEHHLITTEYPYYSLYINHISHNITRSSSCGPHFVTDRRSRWQFIYSRREQSFGPILKIVYDRNMDMIENGYHRTKKQVNHFKDFDDAALIMQRRLWHGLFNLVKERRNQLLLSTLSMSTNAIPSAEQKEPSTPKHHQMKLFDENSSLYGPLPPIPLLDDLSLNLCQRDFFFQ